ncbi:DUF4013 domain-containing protein [Natrarchaeobius oligotrophus]|uniref:DUF4013 domain-containing protein n=1 Tax=Natrarchaeobius chitinivorans TaxID=1679083 RepID=A0A3N6MTQ3_NATCH|nr:DUF4013 domain-containing protein [Natrarchaeobius chitinivorans]RQH01271.1 DUF4013 domain-containing protein [Natrarchaeobius chitinivorans]
MLTESLTYVKNSDDAWKTTIIGGVLLLFGFLIIPLFLVWGYVVRVLDRTSRDDDEAPTFEEWGELTVEGAKAFAVVLAYSLVPVIVGVVGVGAAAFVGGGEIGAAAAVTLVMVGVVTLGLGLAAAYVTPAALANFTAERRLGAGFDLETLRPVLTSGTYATSWLLAFGIVIGGSVVAAALNAVPFLGTALGAIVTFYALVAAYYVIGHAWHDLHPVTIDDGAGDSTTERPAV